MTTSIRVRPDIVPRSADAASSVTLSRAAVPIGSTTVRPDEPSAGPSPAMIPTTRTETGSPEPNRVIWAPTSRPSAAASRSVTRATGSLTSRSGAPRTSGRSRTRGSRAGSMPRTVTGSDSIGWPGSGTRNVRRSIAGAVSATPGTPSIADSVAPDRPVSVNALTRRSARPTSEVTVRSIEASSPALTASAATSTPTPIAIPNTVSRDRAGLATRLRQAYGPRPRMARATARAGRAARSTGRRHGRRGGRARSPRGSGRRG